jgi:two-component system chemotaxis response regulator CheB
LVASQQKKRDIVVIGASAGGVRAALSLVAGLPRDLRATLLLAIHLAPGHLSQLPELLTTRGSLRATHPLDGEAPELGRIYVAPPDLHLFVRSGGMLGIARGPRENGHRPSIDMLFRTASAVYGPRVIGVVLSGELDCGTAGVLSIRARGGVAIAQNPTEAEAPSMPQSAAEVGKADYVAPLAEIPALLLRLLDEAVDGVGGVAPLHAESPPRPSLGPEALSLVCPTCQGALRESDVGGYQSFACHAGHVFSLQSIVMEQAESMERALWSAVRALEESAALSGRLAHRSQGNLKGRFEEKHRDQLQQADVIRGLVLSRPQLSEQDGARPWTGPTEPAPKS